MIRPVSFVPENWPFIVIFLLSACPCNPQGKRFFYLAILNLLNYMVGLLLAPGLGESLLFR